MDDANNNHRTKIIKMAVTEAIYYVIDLEGEE